MAYKSRGGVRKKGTLPLKRSYEGVGLIRRASGTSSRETLAEIIAALDEFYADGDIGMLEHVRDGGITPVRVLLHRRLGSPPLKPKERKPQFLYVIRATQSGHLKIGIAADVKARLCDLRISTWEPLEIVVTTPGDLEEERSLHRRFRKHHIRGEWFRPGPEIHQWVEEVRESQEGPT